ncbi:hypothetical protein GCM10017667_52750 [Streptomyces filamentosus]|uniref:Uncharacterized protein n=1 Tax=Streptomyces filamentosus TaxID=67294 RepID=A0A919BUE7_STRFL|nr:hypothetical protein GCM10017667_52750 [Streptomyces filamentosus]
MPMRRPAPQRVSVRTAQYLAQAVHVRADAVVARGALQLGEGCGGRRYLHDRGQLGQLLEGEAVQLLRETVRAAHMHHGGGPPRERLVDRRVVVSSFPKGIERMAEWPAPPAPLRLTDPWPCGPAGGYAIAVPTTEFAARSALSRATVSGELSSPVSVEILLS